MKERLDQLVVNKALADSRSKAQALIMEGKVFVDGVREDKPGSRFEDSVQIELRGDTLPFVSRGGLKLARAMEVFPLDVADRICLDIGASTGGFTDCLLQHGARKVYSVDVGYGQLDWKLRSDPRVDCREKTNFRYMTPEDVNADTALLPDFACCDVSFISLSRIFPAAISILRAAEPSRGSEGIRRREMVCLIKPQFEAGREAVGKKGVVRDPKVHLDVIGKVMEEAVAQGFEPVGLDHSPIRGPEGNIEYLMYLTVPEEGTAPLAEGSGIRDIRRIQSVVAKAHSAFSEETK